MITEAAVVRTNVTRMLQQRLENTALKQGRLANIVPLTIQATAKRDQYETSVVDEFIQAGGASFAYHGTVPIWERQIKVRAEGSGRHPSIDVALFNAGHTEESRIEFGFYSRTKLAADAEKLHRLRQIDVPVDGSVTNYLILWKFVSAPLTNDLAKQWLRQCRDDAEHVSSDDLIVSVAVASSQDVFVTEGGRDGSQVLQVALFEVVGAADVDGDEVSAEVETEAEE